MVEKAQKSQEGEYGLYSGCSNGVPPIHFFKTNTEFNSDLAPCDFWALPTTKRNFEVIKGLQHVFEK
jgi:hypothetical protein